MSTPFDETNAAITRWNEATEQLCSFVAGLGAKARFDVVVFHDFAESWRGKLVEAAPRQVEGARGWMRSQGPRGGTQLRRGVEQALHFRPDGEPELERIEADTLVVLCDGATAEGSGWVDAFLKRVNPRIRVVIHAVQIGTGGDGTLEALAKGTGGAFLRIDRRRDPGPDK